MYASAYVSLGVADELLVRLLACIPSMIFFALFALGGSCVCVCFVAMVVGAL